MGFDETEDRVIREWLVPFAEFVKGNEVEWGTKDIIQFRQLTPDARIEIVQDPYWAKLMETAEVLRKAVEDGDEVIETIENLTIDE